ncbi:hypothetical protein SBA6_180022 [Candidatus Sulfopaludibacter sp. SbA6]|nr:hypothetical protein SBA6_180022 [Candidatus Sulfopaludibacter sp. SbA6]
MDDELRQQFQALSTLVESVKESLEREIDGVKVSLERQIESVKDSLERQIGGLSQSVQRMEARLDKIAAGAHYVTRLVEWSEAQDAFQRDLLRRVQVLESRLDKIQG